MFRQIKIKNVQWSLFVYLGWLQKKLVKVYQVWLDGQQNAAVNSVTSLKSLSIHYTIHPVINTTSIEIISESTG